MKLEGMVKDPQLLFSIVHEAGLCIYKKLGRNRFRVVYFTGNRFIEFEGGLSENEQKKLENIGWEVDKIDVDKANEIVRIVQNGG